MAADDQYASVNGVRLAYVKAGDGYPLLLIHGFPHDRHLWRKVTPGLAERFSVVAMDRRGFRTETRSGHRCALWSERGSFARSRMLEVWRTAARVVRGAMISGCAHYLQEEQPDLVVRHILSFANDLGIP